MTALVWIGALLALAGLAGLGYCIAVAVRAKREGLEGPEMEARLRKLVALNLGALGVSTLGLMLVILGVFL
ncbi:hypothetical protein [Jannaschia seohaensis]|uniref:Uncharacterized protein n=1 Tax=Jannaschia seohaensis TaxID=475081 RepID=A0A2Y9AAM5_9RHOB|nr:hypothetical protein [Jannaschia seohaensis]PWJ21224.1 hypothetical protein BCF38_102474 [Jannaschia seohaensis]SSA41634.1 hypothetical protein SAMN05421539_102474 [Jannaschia seohaensis]